MSEKAQQFTAAALAAALVLLAVLPMGLAPIWNGEIPGHRNQYEKMAEALLSGRVDLDYGPIDPKLLAMENPYDPTARKEAGVSYKWDHSFYNGKYYMYFGIVPVILVYLPFRAVTGRDLVGYHGTQLFAAAMICGIFALCFLLRKRFFKTLSFPLTLTLTAAISLMSVWYAVSAPALYCTAIVSGIAMEVWSLYFFVRAVYGTKNENLALLHAGIGAFFGALAFGCRPPVALANLLVIPMLADFLKARQFSVRLLFKLILAALPYAVIGGLLMYYNHIRFGSVLEFGQSYQLTFADVSRGLQLTPVSLLNGFTYYLTKTDGAESALNFGAFFTFPVLLTAYAPLCRASSRDTVRAALPLYAGLLIVPLLIVLTDIAGSPVLLPRYRTDFYWIFGIGALFGVGLFSRTVRNRKFFEYVMYILAAACILTAVILFFVPFDGNYASILFQ